MRAASQIRLDDELERALNRLVKTRDQTKSEIAHEVPRRDRAVSRSGLLRSRLQRDAGARCPIAEDFLRTVLKAFLGRGPCQQNDGARPVPQPTRSSPRLANGASRRPGARRARQDSHRVSVAAILWHDLNSALSAPEGYRRPV